MRRWKAKSRVLTVMELARQLSIDLQPRMPVLVDPDDIPEEGDFPAHRWASAAECPLPEELGPASIFDLGSSVAAAQVLAEFRLRPRAAKAHPANHQPMRPARIIREGDTVRHVAMRIQETDEWQEKERARRARQILPKPPKQTFKLRKREAA